MSTLCTSKDKRFRYYRKLFFRKNIENFQKSESNDWNRRQRRIFERLELRKEYEKKKTVDSYFIKSVIRAEFQLPVG